MGRTRAPEQPQWAIMVTDRKRLVCVREAYVHEKLARYGWRVVARESELLPWLRPAPVQRNEQSNPRRAADPPREDNY